MEIKTEADSNDINCCSDYNTPTTGMFAVSGEQAICWCVAHLI